MIDPTERRLLWILFWSVILFVYVAGNYVQARDRTLRQLHEATNASMVPPSTLNVSTR